MWLANSYGNGLLVINPIGVNSSISIIYPSSRLSIKAHWLARSAVVSYTLGR
jgi:hypothetical protein